MNIVIRNASDDPIYVQIKKQIQRDILTGKLAEGTKLPSIRFLAKELRISVITTKRAYDELEQEGYIHSVQGKGSFVAPRDEKLQREEHLRNIEEHLRKVLQLATLSKISKQEIVEILETLEEEDEEHIRG